MEEQYIHLHGKKVIGIAISEDNTLAVKTRAKDIFIVNKIRLQLVLFSSTNCNSTLFVFPGYRPMIGILCLVVSSVVTEVVEVASFS